jgi:hypothetical protein
VLTHTTYTRSAEEDLELGLLDMNAPTGEAEGGPARAGTAAAAAAGPKPAAEAKPVAEPSFE